MATRHKPQCQDLPEEAGLNSGKKIYLAEVYTSQDARKGQ